MSKLPFFILFLSYIALPAQSQKPANDFLLQKYAIKFFFPCDSCDVYLELNNTTSPQIKKAINKVAVRKFNEEVFIIKKEFFKTLRLEQKDYKLSVAVNNNWKLSPAAEKLQYTPADKNLSFRFTIAFNNKIACQNFIGKNPELKNQISAMPDQDFISLISTYRKIEEIFLNNAGVKFIDVQIKKPKEELALPGFDFSVNKINAVHSMYPAITGAGQNVSIKEQFYDTADIDIKGRLIQSSLASATITNHANFIATLIAGGGNSVYYAEGVAWAAGISSSSFDMVLPDANNYYTDNDITVQNHSYGSAIDNNYGLNAEAFDKSANDNPLLLHVFSAGNSGEDSSGSGNYSNLPGFANLTGNYKMAKNTLLVGAEDSFGIVSSLSSRGPSYDGRLKPDLVAFEKNGTSESAAIVSGTALLLQQNYKNINGSALPSALAKAILINTADDISTPGPDYATGFGSMNAAKAMNVIKHKTTFTGNVTQGLTQQFSINVPSNIKRLKVSLVWNDTVAAAFSLKALVNDLDLKVTSVASAESWQPWVLSTFANKDSLTALPVRKRDSLNNAEQITIENPVAGNYNIDVSGYDIPSGEQIFYVVYSYDTLNTFIWDKPTNVDFLEAGKEGILRWNNNISATGDIEFSYASSNNWLPVAQNIDLTKKFFYWTPPDTITIALLRMKIANAYVYSDTFLITSLLNPKVGFVCPDSILLYWEKLKGINEYEVYELGEKYMEPFKKVSNTSVLLPVNKLTSKYFSVAPILPSEKAAIKSYAFDYTLQGTGCYVKSFLTDLNSNTASLELLLGSNYKVSSVSFEKLTPSGFISIFDTAVSNQLDFSFTFKDLSKGINIFRAKIILESGQVIYSDNGSLYYLDNGKYLVFPVPAAMGEKVEIFTSLPLGETLIIFDALGRILLKKQLVYPHEYINTLQPGAYFYRIIKNNNKVASGKILVL